MFEESGITEIHIPSPITCIDASAFYSCKKLKSVTFSKDSQLREIRSLAFSCSGLETFVALASVRAIRSKSFLGCK